MYFTYGQSENLFPTFVNLVVVDMARGRYRPRRGSSSRGASSSSRGLVDEPIDTPFDMPAPTPPLDERTPTPPLGDDRDMPDVDTHDQTGLPRPPRGPNRPQPPSSTVSSATVFHPVTGRYECHIIILFRLTSFFINDHTNF